MSAEVCAAGLDGCRAGWVAAVALRAARDGESTELPRFAAIDDAVTWWEEATGGLSPQPPMAIDMRQRPGGRTG